MSIDATDVVRRYFQCMRERDAAVVDLFHDDARLVGLGGVKSGKAEIREFYEGTIERAGPSPRLEGDLLASGNRVAAEIVISLPGDVSIHVVDLFVVEDRRIRSLTYFLADH